MREAETVAAEEPPWSAGIEGRHAGHTAIAVTDDAPDGQDVTVRM
ncbi:hypothetical protein [Streptomyces sp. NPDC059215]